MSDAPEVRILRGNATAEEEEAVREAVLTLWREARAKAAAAGGADPWVLTARATAARVGADVARLRAGRNAWRLSGRMTPAVSHLQAGRGDAR